MKKYIVLFSIMFFSVGINANVRLPKIFADHAVLQRDAPIKVWGWADKGEKVVVTLNKQRQSAVADQNGKWQLVLKAMPAGGPYELSVKAKNLIVLKDILLGEVWLCSGQSNMAFALKSSQNATEVISKAQYPTIRQFKIKEKVSAEPIVDIEDGKWSVCAPETAGDFSAVAYYFAQNLAREINVPIGIVNASWGGTCLEAWISHSSLVRQPGYEQVTELTNDQFKEWFTGVGDLYASYKKKLGVESFENYKTDDSQWYMAQFDDSKWLQVPSLGNFDKTVLPCFDGTVWFRTVINIDEKTAHEDFILNLGEIKDQYEFFINGKKINKEPDTDNIRKYKIEAHTLVPGQNVLAIKVIDYWDLGGFTSPSTAYNLESSDGRKIVFSDQSWKMNISSVLRIWLSNNPNVQPNVLFNGMIYPITPYSIKGALWYQGESNEDCAFQYRQLLPALIADWRTLFKQGDFPFYFVQLPNFKQLNQDTRHGGATWAEMRESVSKALSVPNTGMAVTIDLGDSTNLHPLNKEGIGQRLSLIALNNLYGKPTVCTGPEVSGTTKSDGKIIVSFKESSSALMVKDRYGYLKGFEIAGENKQFHCAKATLDGNKVILQNDLVPNPVAVRYSWSNNPDGNLYNTAGLPAAPFRTDSWKITTEGHLFDAWIGNRFKTEYK